MSAAAPAATPPVSPTQIVTVAGTALPIPATARLDLAYLYDYDLSGGTTSSAFAVAVGGDYIEVPLSAAATLTTDGTAGTRLVRLFIVDETRSVVIRIPAPGNQGPGVVYTYQYLVGTGASYLGAGNILLSVLPPVALVAGWSIEMDNTGHAGAGDAWTNQQLQVIRVPTGGPAVGGGSLLATPLLV
jgi:hypothetical protein